MLVNKNSRTYKDQEFITETFKDFQGLESVLSKFKGFQDVYEPRSSLEITENLETGPKTGPSCSKQG